MRVADTCNGKRELPACSQAVLAPRWSLTWHKYFYRRLTREKKLVQEGRHAANSSGLSDGQQQRRRQRRRWRKRRKTRRCPTLSYSVQPPREVQLLSAGFLHQVLHSQGGKATVCAVEVVAGVERKD